MITTKRSTGKVGVCLVTSGPGATNLVTGIATANYDSVPLVCFTGQVARHLIGNDAFQEVDIVGITRSITKYGVTVRKREDLGRIIKEAFYIARSGRPGPVLVDLPKDVMAELGSPNYPETVNIRGYKPSTGVHIGQLKRAVKMLGKAKKPLFLAGGGVSIAGANKAFTELVERTQIPVVTTIMGRGAIPTTHPLFIGNLGMHGAYASNMAVEECDLLFSIGTRFNDRITGKLHAFAPKATIVHIDIDTSSISRNIQVDIPIVADAKEAIEKLLEPVVNEIYNRLGDYIYGEDDETLVSSIMKILEERKWTLATAESCTGGMVASRIVDYAGASKAFVNGMVTYTNESKSRLLGVKCDTLEKWGAVSSQTAEEMCLGVAKVSNTNVGISTTGVAGPGGGTAEKPVGLVYIGVAINGKATVERLDIHLGSRNRIRSYATARVLALLRQELLKSK